MLSKLIQYLIQFANGQSLTVSRGTTFADLGLDSLDIIEMSLHFDDELGILITDQDNETCTTVGAYADMLERKVNGKEIH